MFLSRALKDSIARCQQTQDKLSQAYIRLYASSHQKVGRAQKADRPLTAPKGFSKLSSARIMEHIPLVEWQRRAVIKLELPPSVGHACNDARLLGYRPRLDEEGAR
jgi:hypothetical protein